MKQFLVFITTVVASAQIFAADYALECSSRDDGVAMATFVATSKSQAILTFHYSPKIERIKMSKTQEMPEMYVFQVTKSNTDFGDGKWYLRRDSLVLKGSYLGAQPFKCQKLSNPNQANDSMNKLYNDYMKKTSEQEQKNIQKQLKQNQI